MWAGAQGSGAASYIIFTMVSSLQSAEQKMFEGFEGQNFCPGFMKD